jgi:hypothetical protein
MAYDESATHVGSDGNRVDKFRYGLVCDRGSSIHVGRERLSS